MSKTYESVLKIQNENEMRICHKCKQQEENKDQQ